MKINRRSFIKTGLAGAALAAVGCKPNVAETPNEEKTTAADNKFHLSCADWTFHLFDIDTALQTLQKCDIHYLCIKDFHLPLDATEEQIKAFHAKCAEYGVTGYGVGPIYQNTEEEAECEGANKLWSVFRRRNTFGGRGDGSVNANILMLF